ncbi:unnamed protein product [Urochloa humidicola]
MSTEDSKKQYMMTGLILKTVYVGMCFRMLKDTMKTYEDLQNIVHSEVTLMASWFMFTLAEDHLNGYKE